MRKLNSLIITVLLFHTVHSQNVKFTWNDTEGKKEGIGYIYPTETWGNFIIDKRIETGDGVFKNRIFSYNLERLTDKLVVQAKNTIQSEDEPNMSSDGTIILRDKLLLFKSIFKKEKDTTEHYGYVVDSKTLKPLVSRATVAFFSAESSNQALGRYYYSLSPDSSLVLAFAKSIWQKKRERTYSINVLDNNLKKVWAIETQLPYLYYFTTVTHYFVTNAGKAGVFIKQFDKDISSELAKGLDGSMKAPFRSILLMYEKGNPKPQEILLDLKGKYVSSIQMTGEDKNKLTFFGLCKDANDGNVGYFFTIAFDKVLGKFEDLQISPFPENLLKLVTQDDQANGKSKDVGISDNFKLTKVIERGDGSKDYLLEYKLTEEKELNNYRAYYYNFGDIIDVCIQPGNKISIARIPKMQATKNEYSYSSFLAFPYKDKLLVFYNDDEKNIKQPIENQMAKVRNPEHAELVMVVIDKQGNATRTIIKDKEESVFKNYLTAACIISQNKIAFYGAKDGHKNPMLGIMEIE